MSPFLLRFRFSAEMRAQKWKRIKETFLQIISMFLHLAEGKRRDENVINKGFKVDHSANGRALSADESIHHNQQRRQLNGACASFITIIAYADSRSTATVKCVATPSQLNFSPRRKLARKAAGRWSSRSREAPRLTFIYYYK